MISEQQKEQCDALQKVTIASKEETSISSKIVPSQSFKSEAILEHSDETTELGTKAKVSLLGKDKQSKKPSGARVKRGSKKRWRTSQQAEDYVKFTSRLMQPNAEFGAYGTSPSEGRIEWERPNSLGLLTSPLRRITVMEMWSPRQIALFEGAISIYGKNFKKCQEIIENKTVKEVVEFYYVWKMTSHYDKWKQTYEPNIEPADYSSESSEEEETTTGKGKKTKGH
mmetsp:Transcript_53971/g.69300  ORF Transcript_53971/g.69300 Transcript_53971/m.69300 type:complete len:226 (-) Transcript_53971:50-727(-)